MSKNKNKNKDEQCDTRKCKNKATHTNMVGEHYCEECALKLNELESCY